MLFTFQSYVKYVAGRDYAHRNLEGYVYIVTGSNTGIGYETALQLARMGATVVLACRDVKKAQSARTSIIAETQCPDHRIIVLPSPLDLCSFDAVSKFAQSFLATGLSLHGLVNNAGVMTDLRQPSPQPAPGSSEPGSAGMEVTFQSNHLSHFLLTMLLLPLLKKTKYVSSCPCTGVLRVLL